MSRVVAFCWGLGLVTAVALPAFRSPDQDGFPFSTYPMFATPRENPTLLLAEGTTARKETVAIPPHLVANGPVMQAMSTLYQAQAQGPESLRRLCERIALGVKSSPGFSGVRRVQIVSARFDPIGYFEARPQSEQRQVLQRCRVPGGS